MLHERQLRLVRSQKNPQRTWSSAGSRKQRALGVRWTRRSAAQSADPQNHEGWRPALSASSIFECLSHAETVVNPVDMAVLYLDDGSICDTHRATKAFLAGFQGRPCRWRLQPEPAEVRVHLTPQRLLRVGPSATTNASPCKAPPSDPLTSAYADCRRNWIESRASCPNSESDHPPHGSLGGLDHPLGQTLSSTHQPPTWSPVAAQKAL